MLRSELIKMARSHWLYIEDKIFLKQRTNKNDLTAETCKCSSLLQNTTDWKCGKYEQIETFQRKYIHTWS